MSTRAAALRGAGTGIALAAALLLSACGSDAEGDTGSTDSDPAAPFWDKWDNLSSDDQQALCWSLEDFGRDWAVDYAQEEDMDPDLWADTLAEACEDMPDSED